MDIIAPGVMETAITPPDSTAGKRKRSPSEVSAPLSAPAAKVSKTSNSSLSINYLARQSQDELPLLNKDDTLSNLHQLLTAYTNVLDRHESLASNLGARPLGPILIKRFERCFDAPPKIVASHHKGSSTNPEDTNHQITWFEVIDFARSHPSQFTLSTFSEGRRVCQFYYPQKQLRVQISEEDFLFINSGRCQDLIPPLPIWEDEEKEVGTCDVLEAKLKELTNAADMVAARTRQLSHRLKGRKAAILERRAEGGSGTPAKAGALQTTTALPSSSGGASSTVNVGTTKQAGDSETSPASMAAVRTELLKHFESLPQNQGGLPRTHSRHHSTNTLSEAPPKHVNTEHGERAASTTSSLSPIPTSVNDPLSYYVSEGTPADRPSHAASGSHHRPSTSINVGHGPSKHNFSRPLPAALESSQPFRSLCQAHMDTLPRGHRVLPPCDRCRRLRMDCVKNLTSCAGCTKKHARCHWRDVSRDELGELDHLMDSAFPETSGQSPMHVEDAMALNHYINGAGSDSGESDDDDSNPLEDLEALGEKEDRREQEMAHQVIEDEEGVRQARELSRQGCETAALSHPGDEVDGQPTSVTASNMAAEHHKYETDDQPTSMAAAPHDAKAGDHPTVAAPDMAAENQRAGTGDNEERTEIVQNPAQVDAKPEVVSTAFVPLPAEVEAPPFRGGFRAVNEPLVNGNASDTGAWRTT